MNGFRFGRASTAMSAAMNAVRNVIVHFLPPRMIRWKDGTEFLGQPAKPHKKLWRAIARRHGMRSNYYAHRRAS